MIKDFFQVKSKQIANTSYTDMYVAADISSNNDRGEGVIIGGGVGV